jgi:hypothetical protein
MSGLPCLSLFRAGHNTIQIASLLGLPDEARAYNRLAAEREFDRARQRFEMAATEYVVLTDDGVLWAKLNAAKLRELTGTSQPEDAP